MSINAHCIWQRMQFLCVVSAVADQYIN